MDTIVSKFWYTDGRVIVLIGALHSKCNAAYLEKAGGSSPRRPAETMRKGNTIERRVVMVYLSTTTRRKNKQYDEILLVKRMSCFAIAETK